MSTLSQFVGGSGAAIGELTTLPAHLSALQVMQAREYLRTGVAQPYAAKYAPTVAAAPHLSLRGTLVSIPNVGTLADTNLVSTNGTLRLYHNGGDGTNSWVSTNGGVSYSQVTTGQGVTLYTRQQTAQAGLKDLLMARVSSGAMARFLLPRTAPLGSRLTVITAPRTLSSSIATPRAPSARGLAARHRATAALQ